MKKMMVAAVVAVVEEEEKEDIVMKKTLDDNIEMVTVVDDDVMVVVVMAVLEACTNYLDIQEEDTAVDEMDMEAAVAEEQEVAVPASFHDDMA